MDAVRSRLVRLAGFLRKLLVRGKPPAAARPAHPSMQHVWNVYADWTPGQQPYLKLPHPQCVLCRAVKSPETEGETCPWFNS